MIKQKYNYIVTMRYKNPEKMGFTLFELSIALLIIALLAGGIVVGKYLIRIASLRQQIKQIEEYQAGLNVFKDKYRGFPGDMPNAMNFFPGAINGNGDEKLNIYSDAANKTGDLTYDYQTTFLIYWTGTGINTGRTTELKQFFTQLSDSGLIRDKMDGTNFLGQGIARTKINKSAGFFVGSAANFESFGLSRMPNTTNYMRGNNAMWFVACHFDTDEALYDQMRFWDDNCGEFSPLDLYQIDSKMDDGMPLQGRLIGFGGYPANTNCLSINTPEAQSVYKAGENAKDCQAALILN